LPIQHHDLGSRAAKCRTFTIETDAKGKFFDFFFPEARISTLIASRGAFNAGIDTSLVFLSDHICDFSAWKRAKKLCHSDGMIFFDPFI
jgi:hypothetical protein